MVKTLIGVRTFQAVLKIIILNFVLEYFLKQIQMVIYGYQYSYPSNISSCRWLFKFYDSIRPIFWYRFDHLNPMTLLMKLHDQHDGAPKSAGTKILSVLNTKKYFWHVRHQHPSGRTGSRGKRDREKKKRKSFSKLYKSESFLFQILFFFHFHTFLV